MTEEYSYQFWFENQEQYWGKWNMQPQYNLDGYAAQIYSQIIIPQLQLPEGKVVVLGSNNCIAFDLLCEHYGQDRCVGYDLHNPTDHPCVIIKDANDLGPADDIPIAFAFPDVCDWYTGPIARRCALEWAVRNTVPGGWVLGPTDKNGANYPATDNFTGWGFDKYSLDDFNNTLDPKHVAQWALYKKTQ